MDNLPNVILIKFDRTDYLCILFELCLDDGCQHASIVVVVEMKTVDSPGTSRLSHDMVAFIFAECGKLTIYLESLSGRFIHCIFCRLVIQEKMALNGNSNLLRKFPIVRENRE